MSLCTLANVKLVLGVSGTGDDAILNLFIAAASDAIKRFCRRPIEQATYTDYYDGSGKPRLILRNTPVQSVTSVHLDAAGYYGTATGAFAASTLLTSGVDYALEIDDNEGLGISRTGFLRRIGNSSISTFGNQGANTSLTYGWKGPIWPVGTGNLKVVYVGGWATVPDAITQAATTLVSLMYKFRKTAGIPLTSESFGKYTYSLMTRTGGSTPELNEVRSLLSGYKKIR